MRITPKVALEVAHHEGLVRQAYKDSVGVWTWSIGITSKSGHSVERYIGIPQPLEKCLDVWLWVLERYAEDVRRAMAGRVLTEAQFAAALSFHWNTGGIGKASWVKRWKVGDDAGARTAFMAWNKPPEIIPRRRLERDLFFDGRWSGTGTVTEYTRVTANKTPVWGSARRVPIADMVADILGGATGVVPNEPHPDVEPVAPKPRGLWAVLADILKRLFGG